MYVLITGAAGLVGSHLASAYRNEEVFPLKHGDLDIADAAAVRQTVDHLRPHVIFNCAVIGVDDCERDPALAKRVNVDGPVCLAEAAERVGAAIVHFSSNYVFDGRRVDGLPYTIEDEAKPINVYGETKLRGEQAVAGAASRAMIVRTSWVFGRGKASFLSTVGETLKRGERVQAIRDTFASATYVDDLVRRVMEIVQLGEPGTYHVVNDGICSYETFAREAARLVGATENLVEPVDERRAAPRPRWTPLHSAAPMRPWQDALADYCRT